MKCTIFHIIPTDLLQQYQLDFETETFQNFQNLHDSELSIDTFSFYTSVSAVFSSRIEGEQIELDSFIKHRRYGVKYQADYTRKIDDLYDAYVFAQQSVMSPKSISQAHAFITKNILQKAGQGKFRATNMFVLTKDGRIEYVAATPDQVKTEMTKLYDDIRTLINMELNFDEILFFASMIHLVFVKIHPFEDGNGRTARLLEKWFIAQKLGLKAWFLQSEKNYYNQHNAYYINLRKLGLEYDELDFSLALPFLKMLPEAMNLKE